MSGSTLRGQEADQHAQRGGDANRFPRVAADVAVDNSRDCSSVSPSSWDFCQHMMQRAHVALTPGRDFGPAWADRFVRLSFASAMPQLQTAMARLQRELGTLETRVTSR